MSCLPPRPMDNKTPSAPLVGTDTRRPTTTIVPSKAPTSQVMCYKCHQTGHIAPHCLKYSQPCITAIGDVEGELPPHEGNQMEVNEPPPELIPLDNNLTNEHHPHPDDVAYDSEPPLQGSQYTSKGEEYPLQDYEYCEEDNYPAVGYIGIATFHDHSEQPRGY